MLKRISLTIVIVFGAVVSLAAAETPRERISFNDGWRFVKGDPAGTGDSLNYPNLRPWLLSGAQVFFSEKNSTRPAGNPGGDVPYVKPDFNDRDWRKLDLPHDFGIEGPFDWKISGKTGKLPWAGVAWYRKHFNVSSNDAGRQFTLEMDGAMAFASVWLNGRFVGGWPYGYASWQLNLTPYLKFGGENVIAIRLDNPKDSSRWYPGGGIYRNVWLTKSGPVRIAQWGVFASTVRASEDEATINLRVKLENLSDEAADLMVESALHELDAVGNKIGSPIATLGASDLVLLSGKSLVNHSTLTIARPKLWSVSQPNRYLVTTRVKQGGKVVDVLETPIGVRTFQFTATNGFLLNGERLSIHGVCNHHDLGALGAAFNVRAAERQLQILKAMGCNAIRTSHNPPAPELLDLCDKMGFLVMDEAFDCWHAKKSKNDYHLLFDDWHEADLRAFIRRDRNHPCIVLWSIGNEIPEQSKSEQFHYARDLVAVVREEDLTRPVTAGCNWDVAGFNGFQNIVDVFGYNYKPQLYAKFRATNSMIPLYASETASTISSRGEYFFPVSTNKLEGLADFQVSSYDLFAPRWATAPDAEFRGQDANNFVAGEFVWTGFDYLGEPTPYSDDLSNLNNCSDPADRARAGKELKEFGKIRSPARSSYFGIVDLAGFPKDRYYLYQARWRPDLPMAHILPHWTWPGREGEVTPVHVYTSGDEAELILNGKSLGRKKKADFEYRLRWDDVKYHPGELKVVAYKNGQPWATNVQSTAGKAKKLSLSVDRADIAADGKDLSFVTVRVEDAAGNLFPQAKNLIRFSIKGPGEIVAVDNGDATSFEPFQGTERKAYNGLALAIIRANGAGKIKLVAKAKGLKTAETTIAAAANVP